MLARIIQFLVVLAASTIGITIFHANANPDVKSASLTPAVGKVKGLNIVVTGGSSGIAYEAIHMFVERGATVYLTSRSPDRAREAATRINEEAKTKECPMGYGDPVGTAVGLGLDLTDGTSIDAFTKSLSLALGDEKLDILVLNAGMVYPPDFEGEYSVTLAENAPPVDRQIAANHLGHFKLVSNLKPKLTESRIIMTTSVSHWLGTSFAEDGVTGAVPQNAGPWPVREAYSPPEVFGLYGASKLQNVLFAFALQRRLPDSTVVLFTPGFCSTKIGNSDRAEGLFNVLDWIPFTNTAKQGGDMLLASAKVSKEESTGKILFPYWLAEGAGDYLGNGLLRGMFHNFIQELLLQKFSQGRVYASPAKSIAYDVTLQDKLWEWSEKSVTPA
ncbi:hypothetical protein TrVE_jg14114 [Triparma verrucosa]|uniref:NAD(P)-binding protein n=1 Tax=Triparma verrucosa TaxID=1606542 RepID=A0A9W7BQ82_9STRA|nr:hypothetical protein TrVE_jg14114 [Triparma verrucosa]